MAIQKPSIPKGTRDFSPVETARRNYLFDTIKSIFRRYGFQPLETPSMENLSTLLGKYGDEGDKLLFKVLNSGNFLKGIEGEELLAASESDSPNALATRICEKGLRYDLTVPFARYVVQHRNEIVFPFKRYQIQPVWRADRPQKGRYREFYQCDVDVVGSDSLLNEVELIRIVRDVFDALGIRVVLKLNNRKILYGIADTVAIDKLDKIGIDAVNEELAERGLEAEAIAALRPILELSGTNREKLAAITAIIGDRSATGRLGIEEVTTVLNYYTGAIFEVKALDFPMGSICGGGRYDDLTGIFGMPDTSGVGISFGADRIYDVLLGLDLFPAETAESVRALFVHFGAEEAREALRLMDGVRRDGGVAVELYPEPAKIKKQFEYAEKRGIPYLVFVGENEAAARRATVKHLATGEQTEVPFDRLAEFLREGRLQ